MIIWLVEDSKRDLKDEVDMLKQEFPGSIVKTYESCFELFQDNKGLPSADLAVIDLAGMTAAGSSMRGVVSPIENVMSHWPDLKIRIYSGMGSTFCQDAVDEIKRDFPTSDISVCERFNI